MDIRVDNDGFTNADLAFIVLACTFGASPFLVCLVRTFSSKLHMPISLRFNKDALQSTQQAPVLTDKPPNSPTLRTQSPETSIIMIGSPRRPRPLSAPRSPPTKPSVVTSIICGILLWTDSVKRHCVIWGAIYAVTGGTLGAYQSAASSSGDPVLRAATLAGMDIVARIYSTYSIILGCVSSW